MRVLAIALAALFGLAACRTAQEQAGAPAEPAPPAAAEPPVEPFVNVAAAWQPETDLEGGGEFSVTRTFLEPGLEWTVDPRLRLSFSVGWSRDDYGFGDGPAALGPATPWETISTLRLSVGARWFAGDRWVVFGAPSLRWAAELGASVSDGVYGGFLAGAAYRVDERLSIGPGFGFFTQIEDSPNVFPILVIRWKLAERLTLETGRGLGASQGPGLTLAWTPAERWELVFGGRYELQRFRLDEGGVAPGGVGEQSAFALFTSLTRALGEDARLGLFGGLDLAGRLRLDDAAGDELAGADYDPAPFVGFVLEL